MWIALALVVLLSTLKDIHSILHPEEFPNLLAGSFTDGGRFSTGNTLPLVGMPWGFNHWAPQTRDRSRNTGSWWFMGSEHTLTWLRCTHQPSPWIGDWGFFHFTPQIGEINHSPAHFWEPRAAIIKPYVFDAVVAPFNIRIQLTPSEHGAILKVTFPPEGAHGDKRICFAASRWSENNKLAGGGYYLMGEATQVNSDRMLVHNFALRLRAESPDAVGVDNAQDMMCFKYHRDATSVLVRMATSLISGEQATLNLKEVAGSYDDVYQMAKGTWSKLLRRVDVLDAGEESGDSARQLTIFYTGLYRALTFPRRLDEIDSSGHVVHYSPYDRSGRVHPGPLVTDNGLWDTFRAVYPLLSLAYPDHLGNIVQGWLNAYKEGEWLPSWASPGYRNCMVGTFADVVVADAIVKDIQCFDQQTAINALIKDAYEEGPQFAGGAVGKVGLGEYVRNGYLALEDGGETVSRTLDYGFADYSTAQAFIHLQSSSSLSAPSKDDLHKKAMELNQRSVRAYTSLFDQGRGLMVPKNRGGSFTSRFSSIQWGNGYTEGNAWHHSFPPYAVSCAVDRGFLRSEDPLDCHGGLASLHGSKANLVKKLHELLATPSRFEVGSYNQEIHEMTEMRAFAMGQYGHNNQPVHHILYLFALLDDPRTTQRTVREVLQKGYGPDFYAGDEDNGEQGAWYVLSALGLFSTTPGTPDYVLGSPIFPHVRLARSEISDEFAFTGCITANTGANAGKAAKTDRHLDIFALGTDRRHVYVSQVLFNGTAVSGNVIKNSWLMGDGVLQFVMEGEQLDSNNNDKLKAIHRTASNAIEQDIPVNAPVNTQKADAGGLQSIVHDQQEQIDHLLAELSKEKGELRPHFRSRHVHKPSSIH